MRFRPGALLLSWALACSLLVSDATADKITVLKKDDLPRHEYKIDGRAVDYVSDRDKVLVLVAEIEKNLLGDLEKYDIQDRPTLAGYYQTLASIRFIQDDYEGYAKYRASYVSLLDKDAQKLTSGLFTRAFISAKQSGAEPFDDALRAELDKLVTPLPYDVVGDEIKSSKGSAEIFNETLIRGGLESVLQPILEQNDNVLTGDRAAGLASNYFMVNTLLPHKEVIVASYDAFLRVHAVEKENIWPAREATIAKGDGRDIVLAVWDSGVDTDCLPLQIWTNENEIAGNGEDDDGNGFIDDRHGIAWDMHANKVNDLLYPIGEVKDRAILQSMSKGFSDVTSNIESEEGTALKKKLGSLEQSEVRPFIENLMMYGAFMHGTHVAGIAVEGNAHAKVLATRLTFDTRMIPEKPTVEQARKDSAMYAATIDYYKKNGVRVVNMSWGGNVGSVEAVLEMHAEGETVEERKAKAREIFEISKIGLEKAIAGAPDILFITSAGNSDLDNEFVEAIPAAFDLPNIMTVGAVDQAGDETSFTSFGRVDVYANGFEVESYVPGGDRMPASGTSMSSPNVTNLVAKILAVRPEMGPTEVRDVIIETSEERMAGERPVRLIHPANAMSRIRAAN